MGGRISVIPTREVAVIRRDDYEKVNTHRFRDEQHVLELTSPFLTS